MTLGLFPVSFCASIGMRKNASGFGSVKQFARFGNLGCTIHLISMSPYKYL
jgi:hypothetical protein